jgi:hypothetical protein
MSVINQFTVFCQSDQGVNIGSKFGNRVRFKLQNVIPYKNNVVSYVSVVSARFSNCFYTVDTHNSVFYYITSDAPGVIQSFSVPIGNLTINVLITSLNTYCPAGFTFSYNTSTFLITVEHSTLDFVIQTGVNSIETVIGAVTPTTQNSTHECEHIVSLSGVQSVTISSNLHVDSTLANDYTGTLSKINMTVQPGIIQNYEGHATSTEFYNTSVETIDIALTSSGRDLNMRGSVFYVELQITQKYRVAHEPEYDAFQVGIDMMNRKHAADRAAAAAADTPVETQVETQNELAQDFALPTT